MIHELPPQSYVAWRTCVTLFHAVAAVSTVLRVRVRYRSRQIWLDDYLIILPTAVEVVYSIVPWILPSVSPDPRTAQRSDYGNIWATYLFSFTIIWFSRICFMLTLARMFPPGMPSRTFVLCLVVFFAALYAVCIILVALHCDPLSTYGRRCVVLFTGHPAITYLYIMDAISMAIMVLFPLAALCKIKLSGPEKRVFLGALCGSTLTLLVFIALLVITFGPFLRDSTPYFILTCMISNLIAAASLLSSNTLVLVNAIFRGHTDQSSALELGQMRGGARNKSIPSESSTTRRITSHASGLSPPSEDHRNSGLSLPSWVMRLQPSRGRLAGSRSASPATSHTYSLTDISTEEFDRQSRQPDFSYDSPLEASPTSARHPR